MCVRVYDSTLVAGEWCVCARARRCCVYADGCPVAEARLPGVNPLPVASGLFPLLTPEEEQVKEKQAGCHQAHSVTTDR